MKKSLAAALTLAATACAYDAPPQRDARAELAAAIGDRIAEPDVACVSQRDLGGNRSIGDGAILFQGKGGRIYLNHAEGCPAIGPGRALIVRTTGSRLCRGDIVQVFDPLSNIGYGGCALGAFTPYRRPR